LVLARALADCGDEIVFVLDDDGLVWKERVSKQGHDCVAASAWPGEPITGCLLDGYEFDSNIIQLWRAAAAMTVSIVDRLPYPDWADLIIAPGLAPDLARKPGAFAGRVFAGLEYALVDPRFRVVPPRQVPELAKNIVVSFGLRDSLNATGLVLDVLALVPEVREGTAAVIVALAASAPHLTSIREQVNRLKCGTCLIDADMAACYATADLASGGGGLSLLERMAMGVPSISITLAENQRQQIALCAKRGGTLDAGYVKDVQVPELAATISSLMRSREQRAVVSRRAQEAVDGLGAARCARAMWDGVRVHQR
jgi:UDP-2,4-diacetamido-2,4,6-trideoxy-beta-L-altropyranose hydrolase